MEVEKLKRWLIKRILTLPRCLIVSVSEICINRSGAFVTAYDELSGICT